MFFGKGKTWNLEEVSSTWDFESWTKGALGMDHISPKRLRVEGLGGVPLLGTLEDIIKVLFANLLHNFFIKSIVFLYMFLALLCSSSGGPNCVYASSGS